jgi:hypothetical protein
MFEVRLIVKEVLRSPIHCSDKIAYDTTNGYNFCSVICKIRKIVEKGVLSTIPIALSYVIRNGNKVL